MVEVFKTNVKYRDHASILVNQIHKIFPEYNSNFDLEDCDKILRVECTTGFIQTPLLVKLLAYFGCIAQVLPDDGAVQ
jgi:hypothetical protein